MEWQEILATASAVHAAAFAVVVFAVGLCFWGSRIWGVVLGVGGFAAGSCVAILALRVQPVHGIGTALAITITAGAMVSALSVIFRRVGAFLYAALLGASALLLLRASIGGGALLDMPEASELVKTAIAAVAAGVAFGAVTVFVQKPSAIIFSSLTGGLLILAVLTAFEAQAAAASPSISIFILPALLSAAGIAVQFSVTSKDKQPSPVTPASAAALNDPPRKASAAAKADAAPATAIPLDKRLLVLASLRDSQAISEEEFQSHRNRIFTSCASQTEPLDHTQLDENGDVPASQSSAVAAGKENVEIQLRKLKAWHDDGLIDVEDYQQKRKLLLKKAFPVH